MEDELELEVTIKFKFHYAPVIPAKIDGPPEFCYPAEGGELEYVITNMDEIDKQVEDAILTYVRTGE